MASLKTTFWIASAFTKPRNDGICHCEQSEAIYVFRGSLNQYIPVDVYIAGCAASPELIIDGVIKGVEILKQKTKDTELPKKLANPNATNRREIAQKIKDKNSTAPHFDE